MMFSADHLELNLHVLEQQIEFQDDRASSYVVMTA